MNFTPREKIICRRLMKREQIKNIARDLRVAEKTVHVHLSNVYRRFALQGKTDLVLFLSANPKLLT